MTEEQPFHPLGLPPEPEAAPPPNVPLYRPEPQPGEAFWSYTDVFLVIGLMIPSLFLAMGVVRAFETVFRFRPNVETIESLGVQVVFYAFIALILLLVFRLEYGQPLWRSLAWTPLRLPVMLIVICGLLTAFGVAAVSLLLRTPAT